MRTLRITKGNDCYVKTFVAMKINGADESEDTIDIDLTELEDMEVALYDIIGRKYTVDTWAISQPQTHILFFMIEGNLKTGNYGLEITGTWQGRQARWYEEEVIGIVLTSEESATAEDTYKGFDCFTLDDPIVVQFSGVVFPYLKIDTRDGHLYADKIPDGGHITIENGYLTADYIDEGSAW